MEARRLSGRCRTSDELVWGWGGPKMEAELVALVCCWVWRNCACCGSYRGRSTHSRIKLITVNASTVSGWSESSRLGQSGRRGLLPAPENVLMADASARQMMVVITLAIGVMRRAMRSVA